MRSGVGLTQLEAWLCQVPSLVSLGKSPQPLLALISDVEVTMSRRGLWETHGAEM